MPMYALSFDMNIAELEKYYGNPEDAGTGHADAHHAADHRL